MKIKHKTIQYFMFAATAVLGMAALPVLTSSDVSAQTAAEHCRKYMSQGRGATGSTTQSRACIQGYNSMATQAPCTGNQAELTACKDGYDANQAQRDSNNANEDGVVTDENGNRQNQNYCDATYVSDGRDNQSNNRLACIAGQSGADCNTYSNPAQKAACETGSQNRSTIQPANGMAPGPKPGDAGGCGKARTNLITCEGEGVSAIGNVLKTVIFILTILIGIVAVGGIVYGAILYASAEDNAGQTSKAKGIIRDVAIGLVLYGLMVAIINWLIPGGVIG